MNEIKTQFTRTNWDSNQKELILANRKIAQLEEIQDIYHRLCSLQEQQICDLKDILLEEYGYDISTSDPAEDEDSGRKARRDE